MNRDKAVPPPREGARPGLTPVVWVPALMLTVAAILFLAA